MALTRKYIGNIEVCFPENVSDGRDLDSSPENPEDKRFEAAWKEIKARYHTLGKTELFGEDIKEALKFILGVELLKRNNSSFDGYTPQDGIGMQPIHAADVLGRTGADYYTEGPLNTWDVNWTTAGWGTWWGAPVSGATAIARGASADWSTRRQVVSADYTNQAIVWATVLWGVQDLNPSPKVHRLRVEQGKEVIGDHFIEEQMRGSELRYADLGRMYYFSHPQPFAIGAYIKTLLPATTGFGVSALKPVGGVTIGPALRFRQLSNSERPQASVIS